MSKEVAEQLSSQVSGFVVETALKTGSKKSLENSITSQQGTNLKESGKNLKEEYVYKISVLTESNEVEESEYDYSQPSEQSNVQRGSRPNHQGRVTVYWKKFSRQRQRQTFFYKKHR